MVFSGREMLHLSEVAYATGLMAAVSPSKCMMCCLGTHWLDRVSRSKIVWMTSQWAANKDQEMAD